MPPSNNKNTPGNGAEVGLARSGKLSVLRGWLDRRGVALVFLASCVVWIFFLVLLTRARWGGDLRGFICLGEQAYHPQALADAPRASSSGYDGQFYAALATDPLLRNSETLRALDSPAYRATRIMIPFLAWLLGLGNPGRAVILYELLGWSLSLAAILLTAIWLRSDRASPWWAALLVLNGGLVTAINRSTIDGAALAFVLAALWFHRQQRHHLALGMAVVATLAREISYLFTLSIALSELRAKRLGSAIRYAGLPAAFAVLWQLYLKWALGASYSLPTGALTLPFSSLVHKVGEVIGGSQSHQPIEVYGLLALVASLGALVALLTQKRVWGTVELAFVGFATFVLFLKYDQYCEAIAHARVFILLPFLGVLAASHQPASWRRWLLRSVAVFYMLVGVTSFSGQVRQAAQGRSLFDALFAPPVGSQPVAQLPSPGPATAATWLFPTPAISNVAASQAFYVLPAAYTAGWDGTQWRSNLRLQNLGAGPSSMRVDLLAENRHNRSPRAFHFILQPNQEIVLGDAVQELFGALDVYFMTYQYMKYGGDQAFYEQLALTGMMPGLPEAAKKMQRKLGVGISFR